MNMIVIHQNRNLSSNNADKLLRFAVCNEPITNIIFSRLNYDSRHSIRSLEIHNPFYAGNSNETIVIPEDWSGQIAKTKPNTIYYKEKLPVPLGTTGRFKTRQWFIVSNGRFATQTDHQWLCKILAQLQVDVVAINVLPQLKAGREKVLVNSQGNLVGFRRFYSDTAQPAPIPDDWPHHLFIKANVLNRLLIDDMLLPSFTKFIENCSSKSLKVHCLNIAGNIFDLSKEDGLLGLIATKLNSSAKNHQYINNRYQQEISDRDDIEISSNVRLFGKVVFGQSISVSRNAIIGGPTIIGNNVKIAQGAVIRASIIGPDVSVPQGSIIQNRVLINGQALQKYTKPSKSNLNPAIANGTTIYQNSNVKNFRT